MVVPLADRIPVTPPAPWAMADPWCRLPTMTVNIDGDAPSCSTHALAGCSSSMPLAQITCPSCQATLNLCVGVALTPGGAADDESSIEPPSGDEIGGKGSKGGGVHITSKSAGKGGRAIPKTCGGRAPALALPVPPYAPPWAAAPPLGPPDRQRSRSRTRRQGRIRRRAWEQLFDVVSQSELTGDPR